jgi:hypothetical protein
MKTTSKAKVEDESNVSLKTMLGTAFAIVIFLGLILWGAVWYCGSNNPTISAGYVGYLVQGSWFGHAKFVGLLKGPASPGKIWLLNSTNISITPYTYTEDFDGNTKVLSKDNLLVGFRMHMIWKIDENKVKEFVENYSTLGLDADPDKIVKNAYDYRLKEQFRTFSRNEIQKYDALDIKNNLVKIGESVLAEMKALTKDSPFIVENTVVGNIQYPREVSNAVADKLAETQRLEKKKIQIQVEMQNKQIRIIQAEGIAKSMDIINQKLTPLYIQHEAIEAQKSMISSPNHTIIYVPAGANGVPIVGNIPMDKSSKK